MSARGFFDRRDPAADVDDEIAFHLGMLTDELIAAGWAPEAARLEARRRFGSLPAIHRTCVSYSNQRERLMRRRDYLSALRQDLHYAARQLRRAPGFSLVAIVTLAVGIGATTAIFSGVWQVVLRPFAWPDPDQVVMVAEQFPNGQTGNVSVGNFTDWESAATVFSTMGAVRYANLTLTGGEFPERVLGARVSTHYLDVFGVAPALGRLPGAAEQVPGASDVVVLSDGLWRRLGADSDMLGRELRLDDRPTRVIGVMPPGFDPLLSGEELWLPIAFTPAQRAQHDEHYLFVVARLASGVALPAAHAAMTTIHRRVTEAAPRGNESGVQVATLSTILIGGARQQLFFVLGAVSLVLLIACGNVANLLLARGASRAKEIAVRGALGAGRGRILRQLLTEGLLLAFAGAALGVGLAVVTVKVLVAAAPPGIPRLANARVDLVVLGFAAALAALSSVLFGMLPALRASRGDLQGTLREGGRGIAVTRDRVRGALIVGEVALAVTLLVGAGLLVRGAIELASLAPGFDPRGAVMGRVPLPARRYPDPAAVKRAFAEMVQALRESPGVAAASAVSRAPLGAGGGSNGLLAEGKAPERDNFVLADLKITGPDYFETVGIPIVRGRGFDTRDVAGRERVMVVSEELGRRLWPGEDPIGKRVSCCEGAPDDPRWKTVVGVAGDVRSRGLATAVSAEFYLPMDQVPDDAWRWIQQTMTLVARSRDGLPVPPAALRAAVRAVDPGVPVFQIADLDRTLRASLAPARYNVILLSTLGAIGLLLAAIGIYGVVAYFVTIRRHEIGVRMALGAARRDILRLLTIQGLRPVMLGALLGIGAAAALSRLLRSALFGVSATDPLTFAVAALGLLAVSLAAIVVPARRATQVDPVRALDAG